MMSAFHATICGRFAPLATLANKDADLDSMVTHFNMAVIDIAAELLASNAERGSPGLPLRALIFVAKDET